MSLKKGLLFSSQFYPIFWTQFWGAMNDNVFKNAMVLLITYRSYTLLGLSVEQMVALCGGIFILPFFLFSAFAGELSDKYPKDKLVIFTKLLEIAVMILGSIGFWIQNIPLLLISLFLMGLQSTIFGPVKYSILPEIIEEDLLVKGNALVEMGTFLAILLGTILGGILIGGENGINQVIMAVLVIAIIGAIFSFKIPKLDAVLPDLKITPGLYKPTIEVIKLSKKTFSVWISILGISWFWFFGAVLLSVFPVWVKDVIHGDETVVTLFLALFSIGVAVGSIICERVSHERVELGLVPFGSIGLSVFILDLYFCGNPNITYDHIISATEFLKVTSNWRIIFDLTGVSVMSGFFIVPLYTFIQTRSERTERSRVIASNNIINSLFMVIAAIGLMVFFAFGFNSVDVFLALFILNTIVAIYIYTVVPEFLMRFLCFILCHMIYRVKVNGHKNIPHEGAAVLISNHVSFVDWLILAASIKRPTRFIMHYEYMKNPLLRFILKGAKVIPIAGMKEDPKIMEEAFIKMSEELKAGEIVCIFPEGRITDNGELYPFRPGIERVISKDPVPVVPLVIKGMWGSYFSRYYNGRALSKPTILVKRFWSKVEVNIGEAVPPQEVTASQLENIVRKML
jgi:1-acyl-sn-glycerol-3-phosphate acyltransferase